MKEDGTVAAWGSSDDGGSGVPSGLSNVRAIYSTVNAFAALKEDGTVAAWGDSDDGGSGVPSGLSNVRNIFGSTNFYSDSTSGRHYPCPPRYYGKGIPHCHACPGGVISSKMNSFSFGIRSVIGSCIICDQGSFSLDGKTCINTNTCSCLLYTSPSPRDGRISRMPSSA